MKQTLLILIFTLSCGLLHGQTLVSGRVITENKQPVGYATVAILRDSIPVTAAASDLDGNFKLTIKQAGEYRLSISSVGYNSYTAPLRAAGKPIALGEITLSEGVAVEAVVLTVQKPIVTADAEKLAYSVEDDPDAQSSTLEEIIRKVPQLSIDADGNVQMNGSNDYKILVNGHPSNAISRNFSEVIKSMPANSIKRIEVITNPSMKYDAEGTGGVLNIITSKARFDGYNGSVNSSWHIADGTWMTNNSVNAAIQHGKLTLSGAFYYSYADGLDGMNETTSAHLTNLQPAGQYTYLTNEARYGYLFESLYTNLQASYQIDSLNLLTAEFSLFDGYSKTRQHQQTAFLDGELDPLTRYTSDTETRPAWGGYDFGVNYQHTFGRENHTLTLSDNISIQPTTGQPMVEQVTPEIGDPGYLLMESDKRSRNLQNTLQVDYNNPLSERHSIEAGLKHTYELGKEHSTNDYDADPLLARHGNSELEKQIFGLYGGYAYTTLKYTMRAGARLESARYELKSDNNGEQTSYSSTLTNIVPYVSFTWIPRMGEMWALSYTQRLRRPGVEAMSPYVSESLTQRTYGNPDLETGVSHSINVRYSHMSNKWTIAVGATTNFSSNLASQYSFVDDEGFINSTYANNGRMNFYMGDVAISWRPSTKFNIALSGRGGWGRYRLPGQNIEAEGWYYNQSLNVMVALWKGARFTVTEYCGMPEPTMTATWKKPFYFMGFRLGQKFLKEKLEFSITAQNPFKRRVHYEQESITPTYIQTISNTNNLRSVRFTLSWRFGKQGIMVKRTNRKADTHTDEIGTDKSASSSPAGGLGMSM